MRGNVAQLQLLQIVCNSKIRLHLSQLDLAVGGAPATNICNTLLGVEEYQVKVLTIE